MGLYKQIGYRNISLSSGDITNSLLKALNAENGLDLKALTARLSSSEQEALETNLIRGVIEKFTKDGITDFSKVSNTLKNAPFKSKRAVEIMGELNKKAPILNNTSSLLEKLTAINPKAKELQQGIGHSVTGALMTMKRNLAIERLKSLLPVLGNDASLKNHIRNAINNAGDLKSVINNLEKIEIKDVPENSTKLLEAFKNEVKALRVEAQTGEIKGDNFITKESPAPKSDLNVKISVDDWVRELSEINNNELSSNLFILQNKHPELFKKPSDVYRLLKEIKNNPTHFFKNNRPDIALIAKVLEDGSVGKLGIVKESGLVGHLSKSTNKNEMDRLRKVNEKELKTENLEGVKNGLENLNRHIDNLQGFGQTVIVSFNRFSTDTDAEIEIVRQHCQKRGIGFAINNAFAEGGAGAEELAQLTVNTIENSPSKPLQFTYSSEASIQDKARAVAQNIYGANDVVLKPAAKKKLARIKELGLEHFPVCIAKTQYSFSEDAKAYGLPTNFDITIRDFVINTGSEMIVAVAGDIMRMPGLPKSPQAERIDVVNGVIEGLS